MELTVGRESTGSGPRGLSLGVVLDHTTPILRDSVMLTLTGIGLPEVDLGAFGGRLGLGEGESAFTLTRVGDQIDARLRWVSNNLVWTGGPREPTSEAGRDALPGSAEWARDLVWRTLTSVGRVELDMGLSGDIDSPSLSISSNLGDAVAASLRRELGREIDAAEARVRAEIDRQIQPVLLDARSRVDAVRTGIVDQVAEQRREVDEMKARLEARIQQLVGGTVSP
jgi:hypothetical protein